MMSFDELIDYFYENEIKVKAIDGDIRVVAPPELMTNLVRESIKQQKTKLIQHFEGLVRELNGFEVSKVPVGELAPLMPNQQIFAMNLVGNRTFSTQYRFNNNFDIAVIEKSLRVIVKRHGNLRTTFHHKAGKYFQTVHDCMDIPVELVHLDCSASPTEQIDIIEECIQKKTAMTFDLATGPLFSLTIFRCDKQDVVSLVFDHIIIDGYSVPIFMKELTEVYSAIVDEREPELPKILFQFADYAYSQDRYNRAHGIYARNYQFNLERFKKDSSMSMLPTKTDIDLSNQNAKKLMFLLENRVTEAARELARRNNVTVFVVYLTAFMSLISLARSNDTVTIATVSQKRFFKGLENLVACLANGGFVRAKLSREYNFEQALTVVNSALLDTEKHMIYPADDVVNLMTELVLESLGSDNQQSIMLYDNYETISGLYFEADERIRNGRILTSSKLEVSPFTFRLSKSPSGVVGAIVYSCAYYTDEMVSSYTDQYISMLDRFVTTRDITLEEVWDGRSLQ